MGRFASLSRSDRAKLKDAMTIFTFFMGFYVLFDLNSFIKVSDI